MWSTECMDTPEKSQAPNSKPGGMTFGAWNLELLWSLELGIWSFHRSPQCWLGCADHRHPFPRSRPPHPQAIKIEINHRRGIKREHLAHDQTTNDGDAEWTPEFRTRARAQYKRQSAKHRRQGSHQNGPEPQE